MLLEANPDHWFWLVAAILITWRASTLICYEAGPFHIMTKIRRLLYRIKLGSLVECFHCTAVWISLLVVLGLYKLHIAMLFLTLAVAGGASIIERILFYFTNPKQEIDETD